eukprot:CAMPEP_0184340292 /NCGR_PEP_ID=MMETSP1089-20130417/8965_1 /TAXON_ID=38269 ORGANISM="Gloeochaete wittrockiana, Strain SAG46.84" /NCGR_SAMPLE_ID=MMETSP1089 /ASSEMBLY_ACC=CAM_ASM_000445 /LENGTH=279 /DNA_ID=CAMNT_0026668031 /DNA_START=603 /DNA_END=1442 /DNA_ORIENTATION=-
MIEIDILKQIMKMDPNDKWNCVRMYTWFEYHDHICLVFEKLNLSLYDFLRKNNYRPFRMSIIQSFARQILKSVSFIHNMALIHTDLKLENILLVSGDYERIYDDRHKYSYKELLDRRLKIIDFGSATFEDQHHTSIISTRHYRAPEVILGLGWSYPCDIWSVGCILVELYTGDALFQTHENAEHLAMMEMVLGRIPKNMVYNSEVGRKYFYSDASLRWVDVAPSSRLKRVRHMRRLKDLFSPEDYEFYDLCRQLLVYEPGRRLRAYDALDHPFFDEQYD